MVFQLISPTTLFRFPVISPANDLMFSLPGFRASYANSITPVTSNFRYSTALIVSRKYGDQNKGRQSAED